MLHSLWCHGDLSAGCWLQRYFRIPVSYTHLDVYKRQYLLFPTFVSGAGIRGWDCETAICCIGCITAVSYTHLDVYKRQLLQFVPDESRWWENSATGGFRRFGQLILIGAKCSGYGLLWTCLLYTSGYHGFTIGGQYGFGMKLDAVDIVFFMFQCQDRKSVV